jgi:hypothetical protein
MRADTTWDAADSPASRCSAHKTVGARADAAAIDVSRKKWRRDGAELITFFIVQPCDGARRSFDPYVQPLFDCHEPSRYRRSVPSDESVRR